LAAFAIAAPSLHAEPAAPDVHVFSCRVETDTHNALLTVRFRNDSSTTLASILWRAKYGSAETKTEDGAEWGTPSNASDAVSISNMDSETGRATRRTSMPITRVVFRVPYASGGIDFTDGGIFEPGVLIKSDKRPDEVMRKLSVDDLPILPWPVTSLDEAQNCTTVNVQYADGTTWQNPTAGPTQPPFPTSIPDPST
jgi:hypothetical protein